MNKITSRLLHLRGLLDHNIGWFVVALAFTSALVFGEYRVEYPLSLHPPQKAWLPLAALAISTGMGVFKGIQQKKAANKLEQGNARPQFRISRGTMQNLALARDAANRGLGEQTYKNSIDSLNMGLTTALRNNFLYGRSGNNANTTLRAYNEGINQLAAADEQARDKNRATLMEANQNLANEEMQAFKVANENYRETAGRVADLRSAGDANIFDAVGNVLKGVASGSILGGKTASTKLTNPIDVTKNNVSFSNIAIGKTPSVNPFLNLRGSSFFNIGGVN